MVIQSVNGVYLHAAWATSPSGEDFSLTEFSDATYRGSYSDNSSAESTNPASYTWIEVDEVIDTGADDVTEAENAASIAMAQANKAESNTIVNNNNIQSSQYDTDMGIGNPNELVGTNQGASNWTGSAGVTLSSVTESLYNDTDDPVTFLRVTCDIAGTNYVYYDATQLRAKLAELTSDNSFTLSADIRMSDVFSMDVAVEDTDGTDTQIDFGTIEPELIPVPEENANDLWVNIQSTADCNDLVAETSQVLFFDLSNMGAGDTIDIANLKVEGGALATPWRASLDEVATIANNAYTIAHNNNQYFWFQSTPPDSGAHITEVPYDQWSDPLSPNYQSGGNLLARSNGLALRDGMIELATLQQSGMDINTDDGNGNLVNIAHLGYGPGTDSGGGTSDAPYYNLGIRTGTVGNYSVVEGSQNEARGYASHAEGSHTLAGESTAHAEGSHTQALRPHNHSEGYNTTANGVSAHAEGHETTATGDYSHSQNYFTIADQPSQTAIGYCNTANNTNNLFAIGNGTIGMRSDAFTVDNSGNTVAAGNVSGNTLIATSDVTISGVSIKKASSATVTTQITAGTHANVSSATITKIAGYIGFLEVTLTTKTAMTAGTNYNDLCTIGGTIAPDRCFIASSNSGVIAIGNSGTVQMRPTVAISNGGTVYLRAIYLLA